MVHVRTVPGRTSESTRMSGGSAICKRVIELSNTVPILPILDNQGNPDWKCQYVAGKGTCTEVREGEKQP